MNRWFEILKKDEKGMRALENVIKAWEAFDTYNLMFPTKLCGIMKEAVLYAIKYDNITSPSEVASEFFSRTEGCLDASHKIAKQLIRVHSIPLRYIYGGVGFDELRCLWEFIDLQHQENLTSQDYADALYVLAMCEGSAMMGADRWNATCGGQIHDLIYKRTFCPYGASQRINIIKEGKVGCDINGNSDIKSGIIDKLSFIDGTNIIQKLSRNKVEALLKRAADYISCEGPGDKVFAIDFRPLESFIKDGFGESDFIKVFVLSVALELEECTKASIEFYSADSRVIPYLHHSDSLDVEIERLRDMSNHWSYDEMKEELIHFLRN